MMTIISDANSQLYLYVPAYRLCEKLSSEIILILFKNVNAYGIHDIQFIQ